MSTETPTGKVTVGDVSELSPHAEALLDAGRLLLVESVSTGREFCRFMVGVSSGAIPIYLGLLTLIADEQALTPRDGVVAAVPAMLFLMAAMVFAFGYLPRRKTLSLDMLEEIEEARQETLDRRHRFAVRGFWIFCIGVAAGLAVAILAAFITN